MSIDVQQKISTTHLERDAYLYVRQSSLKQVVENQESTKRQYALRERAIALGWPIERIHVIDSDLGQSGAQATGRDGFSRLVSEVAIGHVGIVLGLEVSRLARNNADWHRLLELAALSHTLILDEDGVYDPNQFNDRLLLGLKGAMSEAELHVLKARLQGGLRNKALRGELSLPLPIGLVYLPDKSIALDPDAQIEKSIRWIFETFREVGSATAVVRRFISEGLQFPRRVRAGIGKGDVLWGPMTIDRTLDILHNPRYAGAFVYGRTRSGRTPELRVTSIRLPRDQWQILIPDKHVGYIDWEEFERNQTTLKDNANAFTKAGRGRVPREGTSLLQGRVICGICGQRMYVRYQTAEPQDIPYYQCNRASFERADKTCQSIRGDHIDGVISTLLLDTVTSSALEVALAVQENIAERIEDAHALRLAAVERCRYEAELARRRFMQVDPDNRLVVNTLEASWNDALRQLDEQQQALDQQRAADNVLLNDAARERIMALAKSFPTVWKNAKTPQIERKRMVALMIEDVTLAKQEEIAIHIRFRGGQLQSLTVPRLTHIALRRKTPSQTITLIDKLLDTCTDEQTAAELNKQQLSNWKGESFTAKKVKKVRLNHGLKSRYQRLRDQGFLTQAEMCKRYAVSSTTIYNWAHAGLLQRERWGNRLNCLYAPEPGKLITKGRGGQTRPGSAPVIVSTDQKEIV